ncbi:MAG: biopolymer transporter ExbD [Chitinophagales bacterium]|nr:MAG: biopolymer transporter ExbD [Chitinophagales bacterium]
MAKIKKERSAHTPTISTASLPDIIFILLFFFMVVTVLRDVELKVKNRLPQATELTKLERKSLVSYIYIGPPIEKYQAQLGTAPRIQLNNQFATVNDIAAFVENERTKVDERLQPAMTFALRVDKGVKMGIVSDVKQELRKSNALKVNYSSVPRVER